MRNLSELLDLHNDLDAMFLVHQRALLHFEFEKALSLLEDYERALHKHIRDEEDLLMPIYKERAAMSKGSNFQLFLDEHYKMTEFVKLLKDEISKLPKNPDPDEKVLFLIDREAFYKRLCTHHDIRETNIYYPELDRVTSYEEKLDLLSKVNTRL